jgi:flagellar hook-length control protein FliK
MNMMQNLPFLVAQASPAKNAMTAKQPSDKAEQTEEGNSFKQVLSKQVEQDESKKALDKKNEVKNKADRKTSSAVSDKSNVEETTVDAQLLASSVTAKTIKDVTDGEVVLDVKKVDALQENTAKSDAVQQTDATTVLVANVTPTIQASGKAEQVDVVPETLVGDVLAKKTPTNERVNLEAKDDATSLKGKAVGSDAALAESDKVANRQFANYLADEKKFQSVQESSTSQSGSNVTDANALSTLSMQATAKTPSQTVPTIEQAGYSNLINVAPGKAGWSEAIGQKVIWMVGAAEQSATLTLNPKELGPLQVIINVNNEKADATFISENPEVRKALEEGMSGLRQSMGQAGVELGQANVNTSRQHQEFQQASKEYMARQRNESGTSSGADQLHNTPVNTRVSHGLVDTFV